MNPQNYSNHTRIVPGFHLMLSGLLLAGTIGSLVNIWQQSSHGGNIFGAVLLSLLFICAILSFIFTRVFALKAQDRAIRAEEHLRYFILTGKAMDKRIHMGQVIALRFASDDELVSLTDKALSESLSPQDIKEAVKEWRADMHRA